jgi:hypothetical protein
MSTNVSEEHAVSVFRVEEKSSKKQVGGRSSTFL